MPEKVIIVRHYDFDGSHHVAGVIRPDDALNPEITVDFLTSKENAYKGATEYLVLTVQSADEYLKYNS